MRSGHEGEGARPHAPDWLEHEAYLAAHPEILGAYVGVYIGVIGLDETVGAFGQIVRKRFVFGKKRKVAGKLIGKFRQYMCRQDQILRGRCANTLFSSFTL